jgi:prolyl oligopeptidase
MPAMDRPAYPPPPLTEQVDVYHGTPVVDPYRGLEDTDAPSSRAWIAAENELTRRALDGRAERRVIRDRLARLWDHPRGGAPWRRGTRWFQLRNSGLQDQDVLYVADDPGAEGRVVLDPNEMSAKGTTSLVAVAVSEDGEHVAYATSDAGSDWRTWRVRRLADGADLPERIVWAKFSSAAWTHDGAGFFYGRYPEPPQDAAFDAPNRHMELRYHRLGSDQIGDRLVFAVPSQPEWGFEPAVSEDGSLLILTVWRGTDPEDRIFVADLSGGVDAAEVRPLLEAGDARYEHIATVGRTLYLLTDHDAPLGRVVSVDGDGPDVLREVVPEASDALEQVRLVGGRLALVYLHDARHRLALAELDGGSAMGVPLPGPGTVEAMSGRPSDPELFLTYATFASPAVVLGIRVADRAVREVSRPSLAWDPDDFATELVFVGSGDGTRVPLFLIHHRSLSPDGDVPTLLYGYGGFHVAIGPMFRPDWLAWLERGGLLAVSCLRGGGEYGRPWHDAGRLANKQNVFDDFAACARWLVSSGWTRPGRLGISGRSNGGLLVGASLTQHPELFGAAVAEVGVMDMLRFHLFTIGWGWTSDYGSPDDPDQFRTLLGYSPLHNIRAGLAYPPTLITTGDHDDRVVPGHSLKFAAALQAAQAGDAPILVRVDTDAGHGVGKPVHKLIDERADVLTFLDLAIGRSSGPNWSVTEGPG